MPREAESHRGNLEHLHLRQTSEELEKSEYAHYELPNEGAAPLQGKKCKKEKVTDLTII